jgi:hypothetical protein
MADPYAFAALQAAWEKVVLVNENGRIVSKNMRQMEQLIASRGPPAKKPKRTSYRAKVADLTLKAKAGDAASIRSLAAMKKLGDGRAWKRKSAQAGIESANSVCVNRMHELLERNKARSIRHAAATVAVVFSISGPSFAAVVKRLDRAYRCAKPLLISMSCTNRRQI